MSKLRSSESTLGPLGAAEEAKSHNRDLEQRFGDVKLQDKAWEYLEIKRERWNRSFPYRIALYRRTEKGLFVPDTTIPPFTLPIPPESMTISTPLSITTTATLGGIVEEHNGIVFRTINVTGTTGVLPLRDVVNSSALEAQSVASSIFAGTTNAFSQAQKSASTTKPKKPTNIVDKELVDRGDLSYSTGYYQWKLFERWLESYAALKQQASGRSLVMAFEVWKDDSIWLGTPVEFTLRRTAASPLEYPYSFTMRAWKRINPNAGADVKFEHLPVARDPNALAQVLNGLQDAQQVLQGAKNTLKGVRADINNILFSPLREAILFCKGVLGVAVVASDLPANIISDLKEPMLEALSLGQASEAAGRSILSSVNRAQEAFDNLSVQISKAEIQSGRLSSSSAGLTGAAPAVKIANDPDSHFEFFSTVQPGRLNLRPQTQRKIEAERQRVLAFKRENFEASRNAAKAVLVDFEAAVGGGDDTYSRIYQTPVRAATQAEPTDDDFEVIFALNQTLMQLNKLAASSTVNRNEVSAMDYIAGLASQSGIAFKVPVSKFLVPFPYGHTLEVLSNQYLGTPDRWHEIAALNGLMAPYVDEVGFTLPLLTNGNGLQVTVGDASNLFVNQLVWLSSTTQPRIQRRISAVETLDTGLAVVTVTTGDEDLSAYTVAAGASLQAFLPNTVNSQQSLYIPSDIEADDTDWRYKSIPGVDYFDPLIRVGGISVLLTNSGDLVITPDGGSRYSVGLTNIVQKIRLRLNTPRGALLHHPEYGFPLQVGDSTADVSAQDVLDICKELFKGDPTFTGVESAAILKDGPAVMVSLSVGIAGTQMVVPVTVQVSR